VLNRVWTSDIAYLGSAEGWLYLCAARDGCSRRAIGWALDQYLHTDLMQAAMEMAVAMRGELAEQVILHADRCDRARRKRPQTRDDSFRGNGRSLLAWFDRRTEGLAISTVAVRGAAPPVPLGPAASRSRRTGQER
jgi:putative transposase